MRTCYSCGRKRRRSSFHKHSKRPDGLQSQCKDCMSERRRVYYRKGENVAKTRGTTKKRLRKIAQEVWDMLLETPCVDCGESNPVLLEFDHVNGDKVASVSTMASTGYSMERIKEEIEKCVARCVRCHRLKTAQERGWYKDIIQAPGVRVAE